MVVDKPVNLQRFRRDCDHLRPVGDRALHAQPEDGILLGDVAAHQQDDIRVVDVRDGHGHAPRDRLAGAVSSRVDTVVDVIGAQHAAEKPAGDIRILVRQPRAAEHRHAGRRGAFQTTGDQAEGIVPRRLHQVAVLADQRPAKPLGVVDVSVAEEPQITQPDVVDCGRLACSRPRDDAVPHIEVHRAAHAAQRTDAGYGLVVPGSRGEAVGLRGQSAHRADGDGVPDEL